MNGVNADCAFLLIEKVSAMPKQGVSSTFKFGFNAGLLTGLIVTLTVAYEEVRPTKWQAPFSLMKGKDVTSVQKKNSHKRRAQDLFPAIAKITHMTADALLIAEYCRRYRKGILQTPPNT